MTDLRTKSALVNRRKGRWEKGKDCHPKRMRQRLPRRQGTKTLTTTTIALTITKRAHTDLRHEQKRANHNDRGTEENGKGSQNETGESEEDGEA